MASPSATVSKVAILAVSEAAVPTNTKKEEKIGSPAFTGRRKKLSY